LLIKNEKREREKASRNDSVYHRKEYKEVIVETLTKCTVEFLPG
jgi:hypothetical protein